LLVIGDGPQRAIVESAMAEAGLQRFSHITGLQPDVAPFIHACDAMALVSSAEAFSMSVLESMACGKPVVLTEVGGAAEQIEQGVHGYRVPVGRPEAVADCLLKLWQEGSAARLGAHGRERLRHEFSLQRMLDDYGALFRGAGPARVPSAADTARPVSPSISQS
jgi:glycosyltransferase involved in cell wall biosynthesis